MKSYRKYFKEMFTREFQTFLFDEDEETNFDIEFLKHFNTDKLILYFTKRLKKLILEAGIDEHEGNSIYGLAYYLLKQIKQEVIKEYDSQPYCDRILNEIDFNNKKMDRKRFESDIEFFTNELNDFLFNGKTVNGLNGKSKPEINPFLENIFNEYYYLTKVFTGKYREAETDLNKYKEELSKEQNKRRTFAIEFMRKIKEIETTTKPKPTQIQAIVMANKILEQYEPSALIGEYGEPTQLAISIRDSYKKQKKRL